MQQNRATPRPTKPKRTYEQEMREFVARFPMVDFDSSEPSDPGEKIKRRNRNKAYDGKRIVMSKPYESNSGGVGLHSEEFNRLPALPVAQSDVILTADVLSSEAHLSNDKTGVYSEFKVLVDKLLKGVMPTLSETNLVSVTRFGGMVRYPSGHQELYLIVGQNMPTAGKRYVFFLRSINVGQDYEIVTGYEIGATSVVALDYGTQFETFNGADLGGFLNTVRDAISKKN